MTKKYFYRCVYSVVFAASLSSVVEAAPPPPPPVVFKFPQLSSPPKKRGQVVNLPDWGLWGENPEKFIAMKDTEVAVNGKPTARLSTSDVDAKYVSLGQTVDAESYRSKRIRFAASVKTDKIKLYSGIWVRIDGEKIGLDGDREKLAFENTQDHALRGDMPFTRLSIVIDVPENAHSIALGMGQDGPGTSWFGDIQFGVVDKSVRLSKVPKSELVNAGFEDRTLSGWFSSGDGRREYSPTVDEKNPHGGKLALKLSPYIDNPTQYGDFMQVLDGNFFVGKRVRATAWLRKEGELDVAEFFVRCQAVDSPRKGKGLAGGTGRLAGKTPVNGRSSRWCSMCRARPNRFNSCSAFPGKVLFGLMT